MAVPRSKHILLCLKARPWSPRSGCYERDVAIARQLVWKPDDACPQGCVCSQSVLISNVLMSRMNRQYCIHAVQATVQRLIEVRQTSNKNITDELRQVRDYKNPDFLQKMVKHFGVHDKGSCFPKDVFDPEALPKEDHYRECDPAIPPAALCPATKHQL